MNLNNCLALIKYDRLFVSQFYINCSKHFVTCMPSHVKSSENVVALRPRKVKSSIQRNSEFIDSRKCQVHGGRGGDGAYSFSRLWCNPNAGPDGGDGGNGGHVIFKANSQLSSLAHIKSIYQGLSGEKGYSKDCTGKSAEHVVIEVPLGTTFKTLEGRVAADLEREGEIFIAARGGAGGKGNHFFLSNTLREPMITEVGAEGESKSYWMELKKIAHIGLIGLPNAGKSTLLRAISRAKPKVASYPFTTLKPHIGVVEFSDYQQLLVADIPGLIPGAHANKGLGISFLRHVERCLCLLYVIDLSQPEPATQLEVLKYEVGKYSPELLQRPHVIVGNKLDLEEARRNVDSVLKAESSPVFFISAKCGNNVKLLLKHLKSIYDDNIKCSDD